MEQLGTLHSLQLTAKILDWGKKKVAKNKNEDLINCILKSTIIEFVVGCLD